MAMIPARRNGAVPLVIAVCSLSFHFASLVQRWKERSRLGVEGAEEGADIDAPGDEALGRLDLVRVLGADLES